MPEEELELKRGMNYWTILALAIGSLLGTTMFFGAPIGAGFSGNMLIIAWIILSIMALYIAGIFGELSALFPKTGGAYEFSKHAYGKFPSFMVAWTAWLFGSLTIVTIIIASIDALGLELGFAKSFGISVGIILVLSAFALFGLAVSNLAMILLGVVMLSIPVVMIFVGLGNISLANFKPFITHGFPSIFITLFFMAEAYFGGESVTYLAEETRNPTKVIPKAILHATAIIGILGLLMMIVTLGVIPWETLAKTPAPVNAMAEQFFGERGERIVIAGIFVSLIGTAISTILATPRLLLALARDKMFLGQFKSIHPKFQTPHVAIIFQTFALILLLLIGFANYKLMLALMVPLAGFLYASLALSVVVLRKKMPDLHREFKVPFCPIGPLLIVMFFIAIITACLIFVPGSATFLNISLSLIALGIPLYMLVELYYDPKAITQVSDVTAFATFLSEKLTGSGRSERKKILQFLGNDIKGKTILEYGCGVGSMTLKLIEKAGSGGKVIATHFAKNNVKIVQKRIDNKRWEFDSWNLAEAIIVHDEQQMFRVHPNIGYADAVVSIGLLSYVQDIKKVLSELYAIMPVGGRLAFVEHTDFFHIIPNVEWLTKDKAIEQLFRNAGFAVKVVRSKGILWNTVYVFGIKYSGDTVYV